MPFTFNPFSGNFDNTPSTKDAKSVFTTVNSNSAEWESVYANVNENSATYITPNYVHTNFLPLSGGDLTGPLGVTNQISLTGYNNSEIIFTGRIFNEEDLVQVVNENEFLKIVINDENKMLRLYNLNFPWVTENGDNIIDHDGNIIKL
jgi:hypothetical protein